MTEKRMLIVDSDLLEKIDKNRGDLTQTEFLHFLIGNIGEVESDPGDGRFVKRDEFDKFSLEMKDLLRRFLDFFMSYGTQTSTNPDGHTFEQLTQRLQALANNGSKSRKA